ncbi:sugar ABC transporter substrate-binding protein [Arthrobacter sp. M4]|uniref:ABC transporter substrate-binding protein n=1 Tax=Arthrobacter sp. M4 TaxID=218160 RepID=UPI001CDD116B|nr:sugar ABC transporter substrate-binding protein [Arthrobacter sp. M4]MCA4131811.1 sugar ABC transporter substrate-binding protein [Arthrobacter sp. M4]
MRTTIRATVAAAAATALLALTACGGTQSAGPANDDPYSAPAKDVTATISISNWGDPGDKVVYDGVAARFKEKYPNVTVNNNFTPITTWTEYVNKLVTQAAAGQAPDVINIATEGVELGLSNELFAPMDGFLKNDPQAKSLRENIDPKLLEGFSKSGSTYLMPNTFNTMVIYYNTKMFEAAGIQRPSDDWTWDDFLAIAKKLTTGSGANKVYGFAMPYYSFGITPWLYSNGTSMMSNDMNTAQLTDPKLQETVGWVRDLVTKHGVSPQPKGADPYQLFPAGKAAMTGAGHFVTGGFKAAGFADYDILPWPKGSTKSTVFGAGAFAISKTSKNPELSWEFIKMLTDQQTQKKWADAGAAVPSTKTAASSPEFLASPKHAAEFYNSLSYAKPVAAPRAYNVLDPAFMRAMDEIMSGQDIGTSLQRAQKDVQEALKQ